MKFLKIILVFLAVIGICLAVYWSYTKTTDVEPISLPKNQFTRRIEQEINDISDKPDSKFCKDAYDIVKYHLNEYALQNRLGADTTDTIGNSQNQRALFKMLYSAYASKFIAQADHVFKGHAWSSNDLSFIKAETGRLRTEGEETECLETDGTVAKDFSRLIRTIESYYSEIAFINECESFSYNNIDFNTGSFPISRAISIINDSKKHLTALGVVKHSEVVNNGLSSIPKKVLDVHVAYLTKKIDEYKGMYQYNVYSTINAYKTQFYDKLKAEILLLDDPIYSELDVSVQKTRLLNSLEADYKAARSYYNNK